MSIRQPVRTTIHTDDFRDNMYCFPVESVLDSQEKSGLLAVSTSVGYLLTTSLNKTASREHTFEHTQQVDGSWVAKGDVTVFATGDSPADGTIIIRNPIAEVVMLTIALESTKSLLPSKPLALGVSQPAMVFTRTSPGKPSYLILTVGQQPTGEPVTISTDAPQYFQLASDERPAFLPGLTLLPSPTGTYVHVRYLPDKSGLHTGQLLINTGHEQKIVPLEGRSSGILPVVRKNKTVSPSPSIRRPVKRPAAKWLVGFLSVVVTGGLGYEVYTNRCQLFPALCATTETEQVHVQTSRLRPIAATNEASEKAIITPTITKQVKFQAIIPKANSSAEQLPVEDLTIKRQTETKNNIPAENLNAQPKRKQQIAPNQIDRQPDRETNLSSEESDLERELNKTL